MLGWRRLSTGPTKDARRRWVTAVPLLVACWARVRRLEALSSALGSPNDPRNHSEARPAKRIRPLTWCFVCRGGGI